MLCKKLLLLKPSHIHNHLKREDKEKFRCKYKIKELIETEKDLDFLLEPLEKTIKSIENLNKVILKDKLYLKKNVVKNSLPLVMALLPSSIAQLSQHLPTSLLVFFVSF